MGANILGYVKLPDGIRNSGMSLPDPGAGESVEMLIRQADGGTRSVDVPDEAQPVLRLLLESLLSGGRIAVMEEEQELSPTEASEILGISRPLVVRRMDAGDLPFHYVGTHRRCKLRDVLALKIREEERQRALNALADDNEDLMGNHGLE